jgi:hypothetical protein
MADGGDGRAAFATAAGMRLEIAAIDAIATA